jgi:hypothetical protein
MRPTGNLSANNPILPCRMENHRVEVIVKRPVQVLRPKPHHRFLTPLPAILSLTC